MLKACYNLLAPLLCAVAVHHSPDERQHKTIFRPEGFDCRVFVAKMIKLIKAEDREKVIIEMQQLAELLQNKEKELGNDTSGERANTGDAVIFRSDVLHAGAAPLSMDEFPRITSYMQFVPKVVVENEEWWPLLGTLYSSENVFDRRTMVDPHELVKMMSFSGEDPLMLEQARHWLVDSENAPYQGRVNCIPEQ